MMKKLLLFAVITALFALYAPIEAFGENDYIKWFSFTPTNAAMSKALDYHIAARGEGRAEPDWGWVELLAYLAAKYGGEFSRYSEKDLDELYGKLQNGGSISEITAGVKYYDFYREAYRAVLGGFVGDYRVQVTENSELVWVEKYGLKVFSPIAAEYYYSHSDDFGNERNFGYKRRHLGHDMTGSAGTPVIAVESGVVETLGWNYYGGWRIGMRSYDGKRYYYYAHLRKDRPYVFGLGEGQAVKAGDVIGYLGQTGYSRKENVNGVSPPHLHLGMQIIFDESQKDGSNQIWIDLYEMSKFLLKNKSKVIKDSFTGDYRRVNDFFDNAYD